MVSKATPASASPTPTGTVEAPVLPGFSLDTARKRYTPPAPSVEQ